MSIGHKMGNDDNQSNVLSQEEIDKLTGASSDQGDDIKEENINISSMLSQDEIDEVAGNLSELTDKNSSKSNSLSQEEIDKLNVVQEVIEPAVQESEQSNFLSQEEIDKLSENSETEEQNVEELSGNIEDDQEADNKGNSSSQIQENEKDEKVEVDGGKERGKKIKSWIADNKKTVKISGFVASVLALFFMGLFIKGQFFSTESEVKKEGAEVKNEVVLGTKTKKIIKTPIIVKQKLNKEVLNKPKKEKTINKAVELFFIIFEQKGIEEVIRRSEELIVEHDMDISERNLQLCLSFDLTASLIDTTLAKKKNKKPNEYFELLKLNNRYKKRLVNLGHSNEEADVLILDWGKKTIDILKEKVKSKPDLFKIN